MKTLFISGMGLLLLGTLAGAVAADMLVLKDGQKVSGTILKTDGKTVTMQLVVGAGQAEIPYPLSNIATLRFVNSAEVEALLNTGDTEKLPELQQLWEKRLPYLKLPDSDSGDIGLRFIRLLLSKQTKKAAGEALVIAKEVEEGDWSEARRGEATRLRLSALAATGKVEEAMAEAEKIQNISGMDETALASARVQTRLVQADLALRKLVALEKDWPKWEQMPEKSRERRLLLNTSLDGFVFPAVFHPELRRFSAEGLWKASELYVQLGLPGDALLLADEIITWFPEPEFKGRALELKKKLEKETKSLNEKEKETKS